MTHWSYPVTKPEPPSDQPVHVPLRDPAVAALLAWLVPGLGHFYQGRTAKAILFCVCILGTFLYGVYLGGNRTVGWGRAVYVSFTEEDQRYPFLCQIGVGLPAMPALIQASRVRSSKPPLWNSFMAPPRAEGADPAKGPTLNDLHKSPDLYFDLGTVYTMIAGLLNVLAIYDAWGGPVFVESAKKEEEDGEDEDSPGGPPASDPAETQAAEAGR